MRTLLLDNIDPNASGAPARSNVPEEINPNRSTALRERLRPCLSTGHWRSRVLLTLTLKQAVEIDGTWRYLNQDICTREFQRFMERLNRYVYGNANRRFKKRLRVLDVVEKDKHGRWHFHAVMEPPENMTSFQFRQAIQKCWAGWNEKTKNIWAYREKKIVFEADEGAVTYLLKFKQKSGLETWSDCIDWYSLHNPVVDRA